MPKSNADIFIFAPRGMSLEQAALYLGVSAEDFDYWRHDDPDLDPINFNGTLVWDRKQLDEYFDTIVYFQKRMGSNQPGACEANPWDDDDTAA